MKTLSRILALPEGLRRTAGLASWFQSLYPEGARPPVLVGGAVVELLTGGAYTTGDLDFAGGVPREVASALRSAGFEKKGRHWIHEKAQVFIELPGSSLDADERAVRIRVAGVSVLALGPEEILVDRLAAWKFWRSAIDGVNAFLIWRKQARRIDLRRARRLAKGRDVSDALSLLLSFARRMRGRRVRPQDLEAWSERYP